jgi:hypothetical protein
MPNFYLGNAELRGHVRAILTVGSAVVRCMVQHAFVPRCSLHINFLAGICTHKYMIPTTNSHFYTQACSTEAPTAGEQCGCILAGSKQWHGLQGLCWPCEHFKLAHKRRIQGVFACSDPVTSFSSVDNNISSLPACPTCRCQRPVWTCG